MSKVKNPILWLWEFSKKVVLILLLIYITLCGYTCTAMIISGNYDALPTLVTECNETFRVCIGGYLLKAGVENAIKIAKSKIKKPAKQAEQEKKE